MIVIQVLALSITTAPLIFVALMALLSSIFNNIYVKMPIGELAVTLLVFGLAMFGIYWLWANLSPFTLVVA